MDKRCFSCILVVGAVVISAVPAGAVEKQKDDALLWEAVRLAQPVGVRAMADTNAVVQQVYRELDLQQKLATEAVRRGIGERIVVRQDIEAARRQVLIGALAADIRAKAPVPEDAEVRKVYADDPSVFMLPERYRLDVIQLDPEDSDAIASGRKLHALLGIADEDFFAVEGQVIVTQRDGGWVTQPSVAPEIWQELPSMQAGQVILVELNTGSFLIRRGLHGESAQMSYEQAYDLIYQQLVLRNQEKHWKSFLEDLAGE